jgi:hypothetical protein
MRRTSISTGLLVALIGALLPVEQTYAQSSPSVYTNPSVNLSLVRRIAVLGFLVERQGVQDPFAAEKATGYLTAALRAKGFALIDLQEIAQRIMAETGVDISKPLTPEQSERVALGELPKHLDAVFVGHLSFWGTIQAQSSRPYPVYGWNQGTWGVIAWVPVPSTTEATMIGASVAIVQLPGIGQRWVLAWQYIQIRVDKGGPFIWNKPPSPDKLAEQFFQDVAKAVPLSP